MTAPTVTPLDTDRAELIVEPVPDPVVEPVRRRLTPRTLTAGQRVIKAHHREPAATHERIAELAECSVSTVKRYRPERVVTGSPSGPDAAKTAPAEQVTTGPTTEPITELDAEPVVEVPTRVAVDDQSGSTTTGGPVVESSLVRRPVRSWPVLLLALPAFVAVWSGWVGLGGLTGFGVVHPLPGIWDDFSLNTAITLPIGVETYAAFALRVWLSGRVPGTARRFAKWSAIGSLMLGAAGQIAYHLMESAGMTATPWWITTAVACLPVAVLGMGAALAHLIHDNDQ